MTDDLFISLLLAPLLIGQGVYTRLVTPELPEPGGPREGVSGAGESLKLLVLGDSAAAGVGADSQTHALSGRLVDLLGADYRLDWKLLAQTGLNTPEIVAHLKVMEAFETDCVVISLGVNDVTGGTPVNSWLQQVEQLRALLTEKFFARHLIFSGLPPMHLFPALPQPLRWYLGRQAKRFNNSLANYAASDNEVEYVPVKFPISADYIAPDGFHPSARGYAFWSGEVSEAINRRWRVGN